MGEWLEFEAAKASTKSYEEHLDELVYGDEDEVSTHNHSHHFGQLGNGNGVGPGKSMMSGGRGRSTRQYSTMAREAVVEDTAEFLKEVKQDGDVEVRGFYFFQLLYSGFLGI